MKIDNGCCGFVWARLCLSLSSAHTSRAWGVMTISCSLKNSSQTIDHSYRVRFE